MDCLKVTLSYLCAFLGTLITFIDLSVALLHCFNTSRKANSKVAISSIPLENTVITQASRMCLFCLELELFLFGKTKEIMNH